MNVSLLNLNGRTRLKMVRQNEAAECGLACLAMVAGYHGYKTDLTTLRRTCSVGNQGMNMRYLIELAKKLELSARPVKVALESLHHLHLPAILHWDMNHFVVLGAVRKNTYIIYDPALGKRNLTEDQLSDHFTGVALELMPTTKFEKRQDTTPLKLSDLWGRIYGLKRNLLQVLALSVILQLFVLVSPFYLQIAVDEVLTKFDTDLLLVLALGFAGFTVIGFLTEALRGYVLLYFGSMLSFQLVGNLFRHLIKLPVEFFERRHIGDIVSRFGSVEPIKTMLTEGLIGSIIDGVMALTTLLLMFIYSPLLAMIAVGAWVLYFGLRMAFYASFRSAQEDTIISAAKENTTFIETVRGITSLKLLGGESQRETLWQNKYADVINTNARTQKLVVWFDAANMGIFGLEGIVLIYVAARMVIAGDFSIGMIFAFMAYKRNFTDKASALVEKAIEFRMLSLHLERLADIALEEREEHADDGNSSHGTVEISGHIEVRNIQYRYSHSAPYVLDGVDLIVDAGDTIAITGASGCGKTTLLKVMTGLFKPEKGQVLLDGVCLADYGLQQFRCQIGVVMQEDDLFAGSIAENISFFDQEADMSWIQAAAQAAMIDDEIMAMPMKYESLVGDMGSTLSGGQKQRVLLARALYRKPKILFMDEGTAHLDVAMERRVNSSIAGLGITRIVIAHRPETIQMSEKVYEITDGKIRSRKPSLNTDETSKTETLENFNDDDCEQQKSA